MLRLPLPQNIQVVLSISKGLWMRLFKHWPMKDVNFIIEEGTNYLKVLIGPIGPRLYILAPSFEIKFQLPAEEIILED